MAGCIAKHRHFWCDRYARYSALTGLLFFVASMVFNQAASLYATERASNAVTDLLLDNLPVVNVDFIVNEGAALFWAFIFVLVVWEPKRIPFAFKSGALFIVIRSFFIMFTHLGPFPERSFLDQADFLSRLTFGGDYFFSGHTGLPFLMALLFWENKLIRFVCLAASVFFGVSVILGHLHYSIDVFAAFFITYSIFVLARRWFARDWMLFHQKDGG